MRRSAALLSSFAMRRRHRVALRTGERSLRLPLCLSQQAGCGVVRNCSRPGALGTSRRHLKDSKFQHPHPLRTYDFCGSVGFGPSGMQARENTIRPESTRAFGTFRPELSDSGAPRGPAWSQSSPILASDPNLRMFPEGLSCC